MVVAELSCEGNGAKASGHLEGHEVFVVSTGSTAKGHYIVDERMLSHGVVVREGKLLRFVFDFAFPNPTTASNYILRNRRSGWLAWKNTTGQTLRELMRHAGCNWLIG